MAKIEDDKYYTPVELANYCIDKVLEVVGEDNISEVIEPSVGSGSFLNHEKLLVHFAYDIKPECNSTLTHIFTGDYLEQNITYLEGRLVIGNPPYGRCLNIAQKFFKKSVALSDYIAFILPISQLNNNRSMYEFDLIYSEDLGKQFYSQKELHCCFNIYKRPSEQLNKKPQLKLKDISIIRQDHKDYLNKEYDIRMCYWGDGTAGKILKEDEHYSAEYKILIHNNHLKSKVKEVIENYDWKNHLSSIAMRKIQQFHIINVLLKEIPEIK